MVGGFARQGFSAMNGYGGCMPTKTTPISTKYIERDEAMASLGYTCLDTWYDHIRRGLIAGAVARPIRPGARARIKYVAAELRFVGEVSTVERAGQRRVEAVRERDAATRPARGFVNPFLKTARAVA